MHLTARELAGSPAIYPYKLDLAAERLLLVRLTAEEYRAASFLDDRALTPDRTIGWAPLAAVAAAIPAIRKKPLHFIFHIGHVGSTLLSRLLDEAPGVLGLREPLPLRSLAQAPDAGSAPHLGTMLSLWSRGFADTNQVIVKATSIAGALAPLALEASPGSRAVYLHLKAEPYLATLIAGTETAKDQAGFAASRLAHIALRLGDDALPPVDLPGRYAALAFLAESLSRQNASDAAGDSILAIDFEHMLGDLEGTLGRVLAHFRMDAEALPRLLESTVLSRYSKSPEDPYSPALRAAILAEARDKAAPDIRAGLDWLEEIARRHAIVAALL